METAVLVRPLPRFSRILREPGLSGHIWCVTLDTAWVSQSIPSIMRAMSKLGDTKWASCFYRRRAKFHCKTASELNDALRGYDAAVFIVRDPDCWEIDDLIENATTDLGEHNIADDGNGSAG